MPSRPDHVGEASGIGPRTLLVAAVTVVLVVAVVAATLLMKPSGPSEAAHIAASVSPSPSPSAPTSPGAAVTARDSRSISADKLSRALDQRRVRLLLNRVKAKTAEQWLGPTVFKIGTFNVLGSNHTARGGDKPGHWPSGAARLPGAIERIKAHGVSVVGLQEVQPDQYRGLIRGTGFSAYPTSSSYYRNWRQTILWDPHVFRFVSGSQFTPTGAYGPATVVLLEHIDTGREAYFVNVHPPAGYSRGIIGLRLRCYSQIAATINELKKSGKPVFLTGDMNDRGRFASYMLPRTGMISSRVGGQTPVDWVVATPDVQFSDYVRDTTPISRRITDHFFVSATATIGADD